MGMGMGMGMLLRYYGIDKRPCYRAGIGGMACGLRACLLLCPLARANYNPARLAAVATVLLVEEPVVVL
jgi:hypothetical protein